MTPEIHQTLEQHGQTHLLKFAEELSSEERAALQRQIEQIDFARLAKLHQASFSEPVTIDPSKISPADAVALPQSSDEREERAKAAAVGLEAILSGRVAVVLVAGGQGSRLGFEKPKGMFPIGPVTGASLFHFHAQKILARSRQAGSAIPWYIMTSPTNNEETKTYFEEHEYFGLAPDQVRFFIQGTMPAVDIESGKVLLASKGEIFTSPNGHGGTLLAMRDEGILDDMAKRGCEHIFYFQVDNPFVDILDPVFVGLHAMRQADYSLKVIRKMHAREKLGLVVHYDGQPTIIEYSDLPEEIGRQTDSQNELLYWTGSIAIHVFRRQFLEHVTSDDLGLPFHFARKAVSFIDEQGTLVTPSKPNAIKFETFIFDSLPMAKRAVVVETNRVDEYEPVKNATGEHSPEEVRDAISRKAARWLSRAGVNVPLNGEGNPKYPLEISPLVGLTAEDFSRRLTDKAPVESSTAWTENGRTSA